MIEIAPDLTWYLKEECDALGQWVDGDTGTGAESQQETYDTEETFSLDKGDATSVAKLTLSTDLGVPDQFRIETRLYHVALGSFFVRISNQTTQARATFWFIGTSTKLYVVRNPGSNSEIGSGIVDTGAWQTWAFDVDFSTPSKSTVDVYLNGVLQEAGVDCTAIGESASDYGKIEIENGAHANPDHKTYMDYFRVTNQYKIFALGDEEIYEINAKTPMGGKAIGIRGAEGATAEVLFQGT